MNLSQARTSGQTALRSEATTELQISVPGMEVPPSATSLGGPSAE